MGESLNLEPARVCYFMEWISVKERIPDFEIDVLVYYTIQKDKKNRDGDRFGRYIEIGCVSSITRGKSYENVEWRDKSYNALNPTHWMPLPEPPK